MRGLSNLGVYAEPAIELYIDPTFSHGWFLAIERGISKRTSATVTTIVCPACVSISATVPLEDWPAIELYLARVLPLARRTNPLGRGEGES